MSQIMAKVSPPRCESDFLNRLYFPYSPREKVAVMCENGSRFEFESGLIKLLEEVHEVVLCYCM